MVVSRSSPSNAASIAFEIPVQSAGKERTDPNAKLHDMLKELATDVAASADSLDVEKVVAAVDKARDEAHRELKSVFLRLPTSIQGHDTVDLFEKGTFRKNYRLQLSGQDIFVKLMPSPIHEFAWSNIRTEIIKILARRGDWEDPGIVFAQSSLRLAASDTTGNRKGKEADEAIVPSAYINADFCPSVIVEVGYSEPFAKLLQDKDWWVDYNSEHPDGKLMLVLLIDINVSAQQFSFRFFPSPDFIEDDKRKVVLRFEGEIPEDAQLEFLPEWLYCDKIPEWVGEESVVIGRDRLESWRKTVLKVLIPKST